MRRVLAALSRSDRRLLSYEEVRRRLHAVEASAPVLEDVPLDAIVGSVGRYNDFTREFLPRFDADKQRWVGVSMAMTGPVGTPPVELYRIGGAYFVRDGNHRVSVARQLGAPTIQAYVTPVFARVPITPDVDPSDLIVLAEHAGFMEATGIDQLRPGTSMSVTVPGRYRKLLEHIEVHRYFMGLDQQRPIAYPEAVAHWFDRVYRPVVDSIRASGILRDFPGRTETDLYLWLSEHRAHLEGELGFALPSETIAESLGEEGPWNGERSGRELREGLLREVRARGPGADSSSLAIVSDVLVAMPDLESGLSALRQALVIAAFERARVYALHVANGEAAAASADVSSLREAALNAAAEAGIELQFAVTAGHPVKALRERGAWVDLIVVPLVQADEAGARIRARHHGLLRRAPRPILATCAAARPIRSALVAFDGGSRSEQALFAGAYLAAKLGASLVVATVPELGRPATAALGVARAYLERFGVEAEYVQRSGPVAETLVELAEAHDSDLLLMGAYRYSRWLESLLGGVVVRTLLAAERPVLVL